jgi:hypothetical protein
MAEWAALSIDGKTIEMQDADNVVDLASTIADERAILRVLYTYGQAIDYGEEDKWVGLFTPDGIFHVELPGGRPPIHCAGRKELAAFVAVHPRAPAALHKHLLLNSVIDVRDNEAQAASYFQLLLDIDGKPETYCFGRYLDQLVRCEDGIWRFRKRVAQVQSMLPHNFPRNA